jgi:hypothetical protein
MHLPLQVSAVPTAHLLLHPDLPLHPHLPLQGTAVILNAVKDPEEFPPPQLPGSFQPILSRRHCCCFTVAIASSPTQNTSFRPKPLTVFVSGGVEKSAVLPLTTESGSFVKAPIKARTAEGPTYHFFQRGFSR